MVGGNIGIHHWLDWFLFRITVFIQIVIIHIKYAVAIKTETKPLGEHHSFGHLALSDRSQYIPVNPTSAVPAGCGTYSVPFRQYTFLSRHSPPICVICRLIVCPLRRRVLHEVYLLHTVRWHNRDRSLPVAYALWQRQGRHLLVHRRAYHVCVPYVVPSNGFCKGE